MPITCTVCGYDQNPDGLEFCDACGAELTNTTSSEPQSMPEPTPEPSIPEPSIPEPSIPEPSPTVKTSTPEPTVPIPAPSPQPIPTSTPATAKFISKLANAPIPEFLIENYALIGIFDPDTGPVDIDLENFIGSETVSRQHGEIYFEDGQWKIKDLGSTNGIFLKKAGQNRFNARITTPELLQHGDEVAIAKIRFTFQTI